MTEAMLARTETPETIAIGDTVLITRGALAGLRGTVSNFTTGERCVLSIDAVAPGVQVVIGREAIELSSVVANDHSARQ
jgi:hypothetical protein